MTSRGMDVLGYDECLALLAEHSFGRIGMKIAEEPVVLPVYYVVVDGEILFRTDPGTKLIAAVLEMRVAFEVDDEAEGWSVVVVGHAHEVRSSSPYASDPDLLFPHQWSAGERGRVVRIEIERVTGRRLRDSV